MNNMTDRKSRILIAEDDVNLGFLLVNFLQDNGYEVKLYNDGLSAFNAFITYKYDFCILDIMLPEMDGFELAESIRKKDKEIPLIFLSARSMKEDKIRGFKTGIDDYITKPFDEEELLCRIEAILTRIDKKTGKNGNEVYHIGKYRFDPINLLLVIDSKLQRLTIKESRILCLLCMSRNELVKRDDIMNDVWGESDYYIGRSLDVFISKIRNYLKNDPSLRIKTIPTLGYILETKATKA